MNVDPADRREEVFNKIVSEVHRQVLATSPTEMACVLCDVVSTELFAYVIGQTERIVRRWARGNINVITEESTRRNGPLARAPAASLEHFSTISLQAVAVI
ncbi:MAG: hypothetical protein IVW55_12010 [Chloroflexi bacterium]|nr:hypothetical protein [Chloroflexota bacterium]